MKYFVLFVMALGLISCEKDSDTRLINGNYILISYNKINCDRQANDLTWIGSKNAGEKIDITGILDISFLGTFKQKLVFQSNLDDTRLEIKFIGAFLHIEGDEWSAGYSDSPFDEGDCEEADVTVDGDFLRWHFIDDEGCEIVMEWIKD